VREGHLPRRNLKEDDDFRDRCWEAVYAVLLIASGVILGAVW
jgi:hypothetical protein